MTSTAFAADNAAYEYVRMTTSMGDIVLELNAEKAPVSVKNFLAYADAGYYEGTIFHRVMDGFMIQGGGFNPDMTEKKTEAPIVNEWRNGLKNKRGTIAMARTQVADSATSQFFINVNDNGFLDAPRDGAAYAVFGQVIQGMDVVDKIKSVKTGTRGPHQNVPNEVVLIKSVKKMDASEVAEATTKVREAEAVAAKAAAEAAKAEQERISKGMENGIAFVKENAKDLDVANGVKTPSGLWYLEAAVGDGAQPTISDNIKVLYTGWLTDGTKFDFSTNRDQPANYPLNIMIKGWIEGVGAMKAGGKRWLVIPPELAYGAGGRPPRIPPSSTLVFEVELVGVAKK